MRWLNETINNHLLKTLSFLLLVFWCVGSVYANKPKKDSIAIKKNGNEHNVVDKNLNLRSPLEINNLNDLDKLFKEKNFEFFNLDNEFNQAYFDRANIVDSVVHDYRIMAKNAFAETDDTKHYVDMLTPSDISQLPVGLSQKFGNTTVSIAISSAVFNPTYASLTAFGRIKIPQKVGSSKDSVIFFGISDLKLSYTGGIVGDAKMVLLGDVTIPINGGNAAITLKGGFNIQTGQAEEKTYITIDCKGFKKLAIQAEVKFPRSLFIPVDKTTGAELSGNVKGVFSTEVSDWNDILAEVKELPNFQIAGLKGIAFNLRNAVIDLSDYKNSNNVVFPTGYDEKYLLPSNHHLWRGLYVANLDVFLPTSFKDRTTNTRVSFGVQNLIIDNNGVSGLFSANNILPLSKGSAGGWKFSVEDIKIGIEANRLTKAGFGGKIALPVNKVNETDTSNRKKCLVYSALISANSDYICKVSTLDTLQFDLWQAKLTLLPNSYIQLTGNKDQFKPEAMLNGSLSMESNTVDGGTAPSSRKNAVADVKGIRFTGLHLATEAPRFSIQSFSYDDAIKVGNFPAFIDSISLKSLPQDQLGLAFNVKINLQNGEFKGKTRLNIISKFTEENSIQSWSFIKLRIDEIEIDAKIKDVLEIKGSASFMDDDPKYGDGFKGRLKALFTKGLNGVTVEVNAVFGNVSSYKYWYFDGTVDFGSNTIPAGPGINVKGFGGGAYYQMRKDGFAPAFGGNTGALYTPDSTAGLGIKAALMFNFGIKASKVGDASASFEVAFNKGGGISYIGLFGFAKIMGEIPGAGSIYEKVNTSFQKISKRIDSLNLNMDTAKLNNLKIFQPSVAAASVFPVDKKPSQQVGFSAFIGIQYDFSKSSLHATFDLYVDAAGGFIKGASSENRAGWAVFHADQSTWYLHMGRPDDKIGIRFGIGPFNIQTGAYFMIGDQIPAFPQPPAELISTLAAAGLTYENKISIGDLSKGRGLAFGASVAVNTGDLNFLIFYANFSAGLGFDIMVKDYGNTTCKGSSNRIGINGWYAFGQAYAYLNGELGVRIKILFIRKNIPLIRGGAAALLQARLPNPTWVGGYLGFHINILGGLIRGQFRFKFSFGNDCELNYDKDAAAEYDKFNVVSQITPDDKTTGVSVFSRPKISFNIQPGERLDVPSNDGNSTSYYKAELVYAKIVRSNGQEVSSQLYTYGSDYEIAPNRFLDGNESYKVQVKTVFKELRNNQWLDLVQDGKKVEELKEIEFSTGKGVDSIPYGNIASMYPYFNQRFFYKSESPNGFIKLKNEQNQLFRSFNQWNAVYMSLETNTIIATTNASYDSTTQTLSFGIANNLIGQKSYQIAILGNGLEDSTLSDPSKPIIKFQFTTSQYATLKNKVEALQIVQPIIGRVSSDVIDLQARVNNYEGFSYDELVGNRFTGNQPMILVNAELSDAYYNNQVKPLIYPLVTENQTDSIIGDSTKKFSISNRYVPYFGVPPVKAIPISNYYKAALTQSVFTEFLTTRLPFVYDLPRVYNQDFLDLRAQVINYFLNDNNDGSSNEPSVYTGYYGGFEQQDNGSSRIEGFTQDFNDGFANYPRSYYFYDPLVIQQRLEDRRSNNNPIPISSAFVSIMTSPFPFIPKGIYKVGFQYRLPDGIVTLGKGYFNYENPIE
jgi:hypothetical protein